MVNLFIAVLSLIALGVVRFVSKENKKLVWNIACFINLIAIGYLALQSYSSSVQICSHRIAIDSLKQNTVSKQYHKVYSDSIKSLLELKINQLDNLNTQFVYEPISKLNIFGSERSITSGVPGSDVELYKRMMTIIDQTNKPYPKVNSESKELLNEVIDLYPNFPFGYFCRAFIKKKNKELWESDAIKAVEILEYTTKIINHKSDHSMVKSILDGWVIKTDDNGITSSL